MIDYSPKSWLSVLTKLQGSVASAVLPRCLMVAAIGGFAAWAYEHHQFKIPAIVHTMIGIALGLLLVFRTNVSYDRWWEGRKLLGAIVNRTRDLARQLRAYAGSEHKEEVADVVRLLDAFFTLAIQGLRAETDLTKLDKLTSDEKKQLDGKKVRAGMTLGWITERLDKLQKKGAFTEIRLLAMDQNLTSLIDNYSACERIARTPVPFAYAQHIKLFVTIFCFSVPFALVDPLKWYTPIAATIVAFALFGIDEIGVEIEDPFGYDENDLPIDRIAATISAGTHEITSTPS